MKPRTYLLALVCLIGAQDPPAAGLAAPPTAAPASGDRFAKAVVDYRAGRYEVAYAAFAAEAAARGESTSVELLGNLALAALRVQRSAEAEAAARPLAAHADPVQRAFGEFLLGCVAYQRGQRAAAAAQLQDAEPFAWQSAVRAVETAFASWCRAAELRPGWPEALRNAERAQRRLAELEQLRKAAQQPLARSEPEPPPPQPPPPSNQPPEEQVPELALEALAQGELAQLLRRLRDKEHEKLRARQAAQRASVVAGERDW